MNNHYQNEDITQDIKSFKISFKLSQIKDIWSLLVGSLDLRGWELCFWQIALIRKELLLIIKAVIWSLRQLETLSPKSILVFIQYKRKTVLRLPRIDNNLLQKSVCILQALKETKFVYTQGHIKVKSHHTIYQMQWTRHPSKAEDIFTISQLGTVRNLLTL